MSVFSIALCTTLRYYKYISKRGESKTNFAT
nr:MAG TPA: hypothetical protein [Caudoviricetes sp.]